MARTGAAGVTGLRAAVNAFAHRAGYEIRRLDTASTMESALARLGRSHPGVRTVVDIGASDGRWTTLARPHFPAATFVLFEALEREHGESLRRLGENPKTHVVLAAAGDHQGTISFDAADAFGGAVSRHATGGHSITVPMTTVDLELDRLATQGPVVLKLDTHGFELPILHGASRTLATTDLVIIEAYNFELTPETLAFPELCQHMASLGFRPLDLVDVMRRPTDKALWQFDLVFARASRPEFSRVSYEW